MDEYEETTYGDRISEVYDDWYQDYDKAAVEVLAKLAKDGCALELGIGTGRVALPLLRKGVKVHGIDASPPMLEKLRRKPGGQDVTVTVGDFADVPVEGEFNLIYVVFNTFFALLTQKDQVKCFERVAEHLSDDGVFVIEAFVPDMTRFDRGQSLRVVAMGDDVVRLDAAQIDMANQQLVCQHVHLSSRGVSLYPVKLRYTWPSELDLMARIAGLHLQHRWESWDGTAFTANSGKHISVYGRAQ
jgi:SAM-dependent methyltransferase